MNNAGFGPVEDRARADAREDRRIVDTQHFNVAGAVTTPGGFAAPVDDHPPFCF